MHARTPVDGAAAVDCRARGKGRDARGWASARQTHRRLDKLASERSEGVRVRKVRLAHATHRPCRPQSFKIPEGERG